MMNANTNEGLENNIAKRLVFEDKNFSFDPDNFMSQQLPLLDTKLISFNPALNDFTN